MSEENARSLQRTFGVGRFAEMLTNAQEVEHALSEMIVFEPSTKTKLRPIQQKLARQVKVAETRLENIRKALSAMVSPHSDKAEFEEAFDTIEERVANLNEHCWKMADTLHEATMEFVALSWRAKRADLSGSGK